MDEKLKAVSATGENAEKDEALLECIKEVWNLMENRIQSLEEKEVNIQSSLASSVCRLNNDESQIKLCENKQMVQQIVLQDDFKLPKSNLNPEPVKSKSLAEYVHDSVQSGLKLVDQKQICVEVHSDMTDETLKVFEDVNPYLIRDLPPLIGSSAFETGNFAKQHTKNVVSPVDDVIIELPQSMTYQNIPNASLNGIQITVPPPAPPPPPLSISTIPPSPPVVNQIPLPSPKILTPKIPIDATDNNVSSVKRGPVIITPLTPSPVPSVKSNGNVKNSDTVSQKSQISNDTKSDTSTVASIPVNNRGPPNLAEIIKNTPIIKKDDSMKKQNLSLFDDDEEEKLVANPTVSSKSSLIPRKPSPSISDPPLNSTESPKVSIPQSKPRTVLPPPQPQAPPRRSSPIAPPKKSSPVMPKVIQPKKHKSLFSSSDEEEDELPVKPKFQETLNTSKNIPSLPKPVAPKRGQAVNNVNNLAQNSVSTSSSISTGNKQAPKITHGKAKNLFDDSDEDDDFFSKPQPKPMAEKVVPKPQQTQKSVPNKVVRKSMFSSSESD
uniref:Uncharacterized protein n=1 Tax=Panagrolaimus sp. ES5 TaxID=591445 RepID=A0AC34GP48_9BILA